MKSKSNWHLTRKQRLVLATVLLFLSLSFKQPFDHPHSHTEGGPIEPTTRVELSVYTNASPGALSFSNWKQTGSAIPPGYGI